MDFGWMVFFQWSVTVWGRGWVVTPYVWKGQGGVLNITSRAPKMMTLYEFTLFFVIFLCDV